MRTLDRVVLESRVFAGLDEAFAEQFAGCSQTAGFEAGETLFREGEPADVFYVLRRGRVALELYVPGRGELTIETIDPGSVVGWSWLFPPHVWHFDARAVAPGARGRGRRSVHPREVRGRPGARLRADAAVLRGAPRTPERDAAPARRSLRRRTWPLSLSSSRRGRWCPSRTSFAAEAARRPTRGRLELEPVAGEAIDPEPGQFAMLTAYGVGEVPISLSGRGADGSLTHTIRDVGAVTAELCRVPRGGAIGVRGPFGTTWPLAEARGADVVVLAGGLGLAPLRPAVEGLLARRDSYGRLLLLYGARTPGDLLYPQQLEDWRAEGLDVRLTVDAGTRSWLDRVGFVSALLDDVNLRPRVSGRARLRPRGDDAGHGRRASRNAVSRRSARMSRSSAA